MTLQITKYKIAVKKKYKKLKIFFEKIFVILGLLPRENVA